MLHPNFYTKTTDLTPDYGCFILEPLPFSFANSLGNALRRTLLSSLEGAAITQVKINGVPHMFSTIKGVKESALEIILNLKQLRFKVGEGEKFKVKIEKKGAGQITGKDVEGEAEVVNKDIYLAEITDKKTELNIEAIVEKGIGYTSAEEKEEKESDFIAVDTFFSPVKKVNFKVEQARVGRKTNYDRLIIEIWTDGSIKPDKALRDSAIILSEHLNWVLSGNDKPESKPEKTLEETKQEEIEKKYYDIIIDELNLPSRVVNSLLREHIETVADLIKAGKEKLIGFKGLGKKSINLIEEELKRMGIELH
ncbi:MAG: DNA-directed RNA polymerase subunit alpha [Microgenomates group bacterium]|nr:DNA-directed RNA polymerase subunit alpha [Microgenomates group bacterium]